MTKEFEQRRDTAHAGLTSVEAEAVRFVKSWHRHPALREALWYRGVNLGEVNEFALFADIFPVLAEHPECATSQTLTRGRPENDRACVRHAAESPLLELPRCVEEGLLAALAREGKSALIIGPAIEALSRALAKRNPDATVVGAPDCAKAPKGSYDVVILAFALPLDGTLEDILQAARMRLSQGGKLIAAAPSSLISERGVDIALSRAGLTLVSLDVTPEAVGVVQATSRCPHASPRAESLRARKERADRLNQRGEQQFCQGELVEALASFKEALSQWPEHAPCHSNVGAVFHRMGEPDRAWEQLCLALHYDPACKAARENLRAVAEAVGRVAEAEVLLALFGSEGE